MEKKKKRRFCYESSESIRRSFQSGNCEDYGILSLDWINGGSEWRCFGRFAVFPVRLSRNVVTEKEI